MSLEFRNNGFYEDPSKVLEGMKPMFGELDELQKKLFEKNSRNLEFLSQSQELYGHIEIACQRELNASKFQKTKIYKALEQLKKRCQSAKSLDEINAIRAEYESIIKPFKSQRFDAAIKQTAINVQAGLAKEGILPEVKNVIDNASTSVTPKVQDVQKTVSQHQQEIISEALRRTQAHKEAVLTAEQAQKFYKELSNSVTGKSAKESAVVFEAAARTKDEEAAKKIAANAQKYYSSLSNAVTGKSAEESASVIEASLKSAQEYQKNIASQVVNTIGDDVVKNASEKASEVAQTTRDDIIQVQNKNSKNITNKVKIFIKDKVVPFTKTKQFKYASITAITAGVGIILHKKHKNNNDEKLNVLK